MAIWKVVFVLCTAWYGATVTNGENSMQFSLFGVGEGLSLELVVWWSWQDVGLLGHRLSLGTGAASYSCKYFNSHYWGWDLWGAK